MASTPGSLLVPWGGTDHIATLTDCLTWAVIQVQGILSAAQLSPQFMLPRFLCKLLHAAEGLLGGLFDEERLRKQLF